ncbi:MAG TPA: peptidoglycan editing factor PgeF, partial [Casimicrobiaceae bacterium]|nr:peptidoglycan editing factor PgeF [Casimicrobiaceae bacterium]
MSGEDASLAERIAAAGYDWVVPQWQAPPSVYAFVTTRNGGVGTGVRASLDLGGSTLPSSPDEAAAVVENRARVQAFLPSPPVWLAQVHGADVATIGPTAPPAPPRADAAITREPDVVLAARVADCMPVLFADRDASVVAVAHAGWRGLAASILENTVAAMTCSPARIVAWLGPAIGRRAFEVGSDVYDAFVGQDASARTAFTAKSPGKWLADLEALAQMRLARAGVHAIDGGGLCTFSDRARFFSYRRDGTSGRMAAFVWRERAR